MDKIITLLFIIQLIILSCSDDSIQNSDEGYTISDGLILSKDLTKTSCSGGWFVKIVNDTMRIFNMADEISSLIKDKQLPVYVTIKWKKIATGCGENNPRLIEIKGIKLAEFITSEAEILVRDFRKCMCCGGWLVKIGTDTSRIFNMPVDFEKLLDTIQIPVPVIISWKKMLGGCAETMPDLIEVNKIFLKDSGYTITDGQITGEDYRECMCCGGWFIKIGSDNFRAFYFPDEFSKILMGKALPVDVTLSWRKMTDDCGKVMNDLINIGQIYLK